MTANNSTTHALFLEDLLPLRSLVITLEFLAPARFSFFHQPALTAFLRRLLAECDNFDQLFVTDAPETGRLSYRTGDHYRFQLIALDGADEQLLHLLNRLAALPAQAPVTDQDVALRDNLRLLAVQDSFSGAPVHSLEDSCLYGPQQLTEEALLWQNHCHRLHWRWLSPARLLRDKSERGRLKGELRYCRDKHHLPVGLLLNRLYDSVADLLQRRGCTRRPVRNAPPVVEQEASHLFWVDAQYRNANGMDVMGGAMGELEISNCQQLDISWWRLLILGQYLGIGQRRTFGWGRYQLESSEGAISYPRVYAARPLLASVLEMDNLHRAYRKVKQNLSTDRPPPEADIWVAEGHEQEIEDAPADDDIPEDILLRLSKSLAENRYQAPRLRGWLLEKSSGGYRALAVPPFWDRVLQRSVAQVLTPMLEQIMYGGSYGYRPGRSRQKARDAIQQAWREGYHWVFESDLKDFFDSVQHHRLKVRLNAVLGDDPLVPRIIEWMAADVEFSGEVIKRHAGLPQGSPLSPLLANLVLDDFDSDMEKSGFRLIRFADDFIVMCKNPAQARKAEIRARESLAEHGLRLNEDKTHIKALDEGLRYLGYLFVNDMALDVGGSQSALNDTDKTKRHSHPWLEQVASHPLHALSENPSPGELTQLASPPAVTQVGERDDSGIVLCVTGKVSVLSSRGGRVRVHRDDELLTEQPWQSLQAVVLLGNHHITTPALRAAMAAGVAVHLTDGMGRYQGTAWSGVPGNSGHYLWLRQQHCFKNPEQCLVMAVSLVDARIRHMAEVLRNRGLVGYKEMRLLLKELPRAKDLKQLNGYEGAAAARYFRALAQVVPAEFDFNGRNRQPPKDPFNVMLSLGYTLLYGYTDSLIRVAGLLPWLGFYHQPHGRHATLASDLMEPFRHRVERKALALIRKGQIKPGDFQYRDGGCSMDKKVLRFYLSELTGDFEQQVTAQGESQAQRLTDHLMAQNRSLLETINSETPFKPWRTR